jgi:hypothetical protein
VNKKHETLVRFMKTVNGMMALIAIYALFFLYLYWTYQI